MRKPFQKSLRDIPVEEAHGGSGSRQLILSAADPVSQHLQAMTKGFLPPQGVFDWHHHEGVDEFFLVLSGSGHIQFDDGSSHAFAPGDIIYTPADCRHRIENTSSENSEFYFIRVNA